MFLLELAFTGGLSAQTESDFTQQEVIYGHKDGMALTMIVLKPKSSPNGKGIIHVVSGGYISSLSMLPMVKDLSKPLLDRGYVVFAVMHGSQPKYTIPEIIPDIHRAVRFIRYHAHNYRIDPERLGIMGGSAGGHLSLMLATVEDKPDPTAKDPVDRISSRVQAVASFYGATDYPNYGFTTKLNESTLAEYNVAAPFDFTEWDTTSKTFIKVTHAQERSIKLKEISPIYFVTPDDPPIMIAHGDADELVPLQQSERFIQKLKEAKVPCQLIVKKGGGHGWKGQDVE